MSVNAWIVVGDQPAVGNLVTVTRAQFDRKAAA